MPGRSLLLGILLLFWKFDLKNATKKFRLQKWIFLGTLMSPCYIVLGFRRAPTHLWILVA